MKLGTETGSMTNYLMSDEKTDVPQVGDGATLLLWSDRKAATVTKVSKSGKTVTVQEDKAIRTDKNGMSESQTYTYERNPKGASYTIRMTKLGWKVSRLGWSVVFGKRCAYFDFSF